MLRSENRFAVFRSTWRFNSSNAAICRHQLTCAEKQLRLDLLTWTPEILSALSAAFKSWLKLWSQLSTLETCHAASAASGSLGAQRCLWRSKILCFVICFFITSVRVWLFPPFRKFSIQCVVRIKSIWGRNTSLGFQLDCGAIFFNHNNPEVCGHACVPVCMCLRHNPLISHSYSDMMGLRVSGAASTWRDVNYMWSRSKRRVKQTEQGRDVIRVGAGGEGEIFLDSWRLAVFRVDTTRRALKIVFPPPTGWNQLRVIVCFWLVYTAHRRSDGREEGPGGSPPFDVRQNGGNFKSTTGNH